MEAAHQQEIADMATCLGQENAKVIPLKPSWLRLACL